MLSSFHSALNALSPDEPAALPQHVPCAASTAPKARSVASPTRLFPASCSCRRRERAALSFNAEPTAAPAQRGGRMGTKKTKRWRMRWTPGHTYKGDLPAVLSHICVRALNVSARASGVTDAAKCKPQFCKRACRIAQRCCDGLNTWCGQQK